jgi:protein-tyrosine-phosphatase
MIVFVCDRNSTLSPMAEAIGRHLAPNIEFQSAGAIQTSIHVRVHSTLRANSISGFALTSKTMWSLDFDNVQYVISLVSKEDTPKIPSRYKIRYWLLPDPTWDPMEEQEDSFQALYEELERRLSNFLRAETLDI